MSAFQLNLPPQKKGVVFATAQKHGFVNVTSTIFNDEISRIPYISSCTIYVKTPFTIPYYCTVAKTSTLFLGWTHLYMKVKGHSHVSKVSF